MKIPIGWICIATYLPDAVFAAEMGPGFRRDDTVLGGKATSMTELVFRDDAYARSCTARVTGVDARGIRRGDRDRRHGEGGGARRGDPCRGAGHRLARAGCRGHSRNRLGEAPP